VGLEELELMGGIRGVRTNGWVRTNGRDYGLELMGGVRGVMV